MMTATTTMITVITRRVWKQILHPSLFTLLFMSLFSCSDQSDIGTDSSNAKAGENIGIAFSGSVVPSQQATRANSTIVKLGDTQLPTTANSGFYAGLFGCYTGQYTWGELVMLSSVMADGSITSAELDYLQSETDNFDSYDSETTLQTDAPKILKEYYTPDLLYNAKATIGENGTLTYEPVRFWPNTRLPDPATGHEYCTFFAYYPYNPTAEIGDYGISIIPSEVGEGTGMGRVKFTMQPDAANQNDFMISEPVINCNRDTYPLVEGPQGTYTPKPVPLCFHHLLAQVRIYAYIRGYDRMVYLEGTATQEMLDTWNGTKFTDTNLENNATKKYFRKSDGLSSVVPVGGWLQVGDVVNDVTMTAENISTYGDLKPAVMDQYGTWVELKVGDQIPDESKCERWERTAVWDVNHKRRRAMLSYQLEFNNIKTTTTFYPVYGTPTTIGYEPASTLGSATVTDYIMNPYWYRFNDKGQRDYLNDDYMFGYFDDQADYTAGGGALQYTLGEKNYDAVKHKYYNFAQSNILLVVPQELDDDDVPHIVLTAKGPKSGSSETVEYSARLTINMLKMNIEWRSGVIYCYGILDDLRPGDDIVRGPESITTIFDTDQYTDQW